MVIRAQNLSKSFRVYKKSPGLSGSIKAFFHREWLDNVAVKPFDLSIRRGEFIGLLGPNGAGKTTLMKMFTGIIVPTAGKVEVIGYKPFERQLAFRRKIALVMGQKSQLWWDIPAMDSFLLLQRYYEIGDNDFKQRLRDLSRLLDVEGQLQTHVRKLSLGERMKLELMASLMHRPDVIFLDEPTIGLDLVAQKNIRDFLLDYQKQNGTTILLTSHYMADVTALCERIVLIHGGAKRFDGPIAQFGQILGSEKFVTVRFAAAPSKMDSFWADFGPDWTANDTQVELRIPEARLREAGRLILERYPVTDFTTENMPIERVMKTLMARPELLPG